MTFDVAVIGTGAGGATAARELSKKGLKGLNFGKRKTPQNRYIRKSH